jgi:hypothetical protein
MKIDFSDFDYEPWMPLLKLVKREMDRRLASGAYDRPEGDREHDLMDDLEMVEWILYAAYPPDGKDRERPSE